MPRLLIASLMLTLAPVAHAQFDLSLYNSRVGIVGEYRNTVHPEFIQASIMYAGGAVGDFNRDGWPDIFMLAGDTHPDRLYINNGDGTFTDRAAQWGVNRTHVGGSANVGDYDDDGWLDIYVTSMGPNNLAQQTGQQILYRNTGTGRFVNVAEAAGVNDLGEVEPDGFSSAWGDYDLDGDLDLAVTMWKEANHGLTLFRNEGDGTFTRRNEAIGLDTTNMRGFTPVFADMDGDRYPELLVAADFGTCSYYVNRGNGSFRRLTRGQVGLNDTNGMGQCVADLTGDGRLDWYVSNICCGDVDPSMYEGQNLYENLGNHDYVDIARESGVEHAEWGWGADACDLNNDGLLDILTVNGWFYTGLMPNRLFMNNGDGTWSDIAADVGFDDYGLSRGVISCDYDKDGDLDVMVFNHDSGCRFYRNELRSPGADNPVGTNYLDVRLSTRHRPDLAPEGRGATIELINDSEVALRYVDGAPTFLSTCDIAEHFGLGVHKRVDMIRVTWPDGVVSEFTEVEAGKTHLFEAPPSCAFPDSTGDGLPDFGNFDPTGDGVADVEDVYASRGTDVNGDSIYSQGDVRCMAAYVRRPEVNNIR